MRVVDAVRDALPQCPEEFTPRDVSDVCGLNISQVGRALRSMLRFGMVERVSVPQNPSEPSVWRIARDDSPPPSVSEVPVTVNPRRHTCAYIPSNTSELALRARSWLDVAPTGTEFTVNSLLAEVSDGERGNGSGRRIVHNQVDHHPRVTVSRVEFKGDRRTGLVYILGEHRPRGEPLRPKRI